MNAIKSHALGLFETLTRELLLNRIKQRAVHNRRLLAGQDLALVFDLSDIEAIPQ